MQYRDGWTYYVILVDYQRAWLEEERCTSLAEARRVRDAVIWVAWLLPIDTELRLVRLRPGHIDLLACQQIEGRRTRKARRRARAIRDAVSS